MTRGEKRCITCGQAGHVSASCPEGKRGTPALLRWACTFAVLLLAGCTTAPTIPLTPEMAKACAEQGGCVPATRAALAVLVGQAIEARKTCGKETAL